MKNEPAKMSIAEAADVVRKENEALRTERDRLKAEVEQLRLERNHAWADKKANGERAARAELQLSEERKRCVEILMGNICDGHQEPPTFEQQIAGRCDFCDRLWDSVRRIQKSQGQSKLTEADIWKNVAQGAEAEQDRYRDAYKAERERAAKIAESHRCHVYDCGDKIAKQIRGSEGSGKKGDGCPSCDGWGGGQEEGPCQDCGGSGLFKDYKPGRRSDGERNGG